MSSSLLYIIFAFTVNGTTGEGISLNLEERKRVAEKWIEVGKGK